MNTYEVFKRSSHVIVKDTIKKITTVHDNCVVINDDVVMYSHIEIIDTFNRDGYNYVVIAPYWGKE